MTTPSRRHEIATRRARKQKISLLRRRYATAASDIERNRILEKVRRLSPTINIDEFTRSSTAGR